MRPEHCVTRNHIEVWNGRALPPGAQRIGFRTLLRGSLQPLLLWTGAGCLLYLLHPAAAAAVAGVLLLFFLLGLGLRLKAGHTARCGAYGALGGVLDKSMMGFEP
ncbi:hypothetical protein ACFXGT_15690 [Streptomyces sp. NPDC059352]|uniref:hypothetical protein n=1 Tax=Streptomyces sp. NPDC059352 TaxID=3346810 RepID=UPI00367FBBFA